VNLLTVVAVLKAKPGKEEALREALLGLVEPTRAEAGCVQYDLHVSTDKPAEFVFFEKWVSQQALDEHLQKPHLVGLRSRADELFAEPPDIRTYSRLA
jgi:quinol monooxygenase YgiN